MPATAKHKIESLYSAHLEQLRGHYDEALQANGFDAVAVGAGIELSHIFDDQHYPFSPTPLFVQWLPSRQLRESVLYYRPGERPVLLLYRPDDIWQAWPEVPDGPWQALLDVRRCNSTEQLDAELGQLAGRVAWLGEPKQWRHAPATDTINPNGVLLHLNFYRPGRTAYEIECIRAATELAVPAHRAAEEAFRNGESEFGILLAFLSACGQTENELPYQAIVAKNAHGAVLHYQHYERAAGAHHSLLIDAGCQHFGYASDITRTYADGDADFAALIKALDSLQQQIAARVKPGVSFADLHADTHTAIGALLLDAGIVTSTTTDLVASGITGTFFPHGLGHYLGLQVHEVGGHLANPDGTEHERDARFPNLRLLRTLEAGQVLTIEPGIYFIDTLLDKLRAGPAAGAINWALIEHLKKFGGIRIEDNVLVVEDGQLNLTREAFARL